MMNRSATLFTLVLVLVTFDSACEKAPPTSSSPIDPIVGAYTLTLTAASECATIPEAVRHRTYAARIDGNERYVVTLSGAVFLTEERSPDGIGPCRAFSELGCNQFRVSRHGEEIEVQMIPDYQRLDDEFGGWGGSIVEQTAPGAFLGVSGTGRGRLDGETMVVTLAGRLWYSPAEPVFRHVDCSTTDLHLAFTRR
jgi:hypothetical protein